MESSHDFFIRTTDPEHERRVQAFVQLLQDRDQLYEGTYAGLYCSSCEMFYAESDLIQPGNFCARSTTAGRVGGGAKLVLPAARWAPRLLELYDATPSSCARGPATTRRGR